MDVKDTNPKDAIGSAKLPLDLVPDTMKVALAAAFAEGAAKYGKANWRVAGARASVYKAALDRHMMSWWNGEDVDLESGLPHLYKAAACIAILIECATAKNLNDDRPPSLADLPVMVDRAERSVAELRARHAGKNPRHYTIADTLPRFVPLRFEPVPEVTDTSVKTAEEDPPILARRDPAHVTPPGAECPKHPATAQYACAYPRCSCVFTNTR